MSVLLYPADVYACGQLRLTWPAELLQAAGHPILIDPPGERRLRVAVTGPEDHPDSQVSDVIVPDGVDVVVFQRPLHRFIMQAVPVLRAKGIATVVDMDDDVRSIHRDNAAFLHSHPRAARQELKRYGLTGKQLDEAERRYAARKTLVNSYDHVVQACRDATLVTVSTPKLLPRYAAHGRGQVIPNYLPDHYYGLNHDDTGPVCWPAALSTHPNDPAVVGNALHRLLQDVPGLRYAELGGRFEGQRTHADAFNLGRYADRVDDWGSVELLDWPAALARIGVGMAPLADTTFSAAKSWLKPLELSAVGVPWVASPRIEYRRLHTLGAGWLAEKPQDWYRKLKLLAGSAAARSELSAAGRAVAEDLRLARHVWQHWEAWQRAVGIQQGREHARAVLA